MRVFMNDEKLPPQTQAEALPVDARRNEARPPEPPSQDPHRKLRELLAIPERERTDAIWDEIIGLEIQLAPGNRTPSPQSDANRRQEPGRHQEQGRRPEQARQRQFTPGTKPAKHSFKKRRRDPASPPKR